jgi:hypothetical protein
MALAQLSPQPGPAPQPAGHIAIRRCTYRRLGRISDAAGAEYEVSCLYPGRKVALPIGDQVTSLAVCSSCSASHIFRPDED